MRNFAEYVAPELGWIPATSGPVEGYPIDMQTPLLAGQKLTGYSGFMGIASVYRDAGFVEVDRASETQLIMRLIID